MTLIILYDNLCIDNLFKVIQRIYTRIFSRNSKINRNTFLDFFVNQLWLTDLTFYVSEVATVSSGSIKVGARGGEVSCGLALVPAEAEAARVTRAGSEEVGPGEAGGSPDFVRRRRKFHPYPHFHLSPFFLLLTLPYGSDKFGGVRHRPPPETLSTAWHRPRNQPFSRRE